MALLDELGAAIRAAGEQAGGSVVHIGGSWRGGAGVVVGTGLVLTNAHNVRHDVVTVTFADGRQAEAEPKGADVDGDVAVLGVDTGSAAALEWATGGVQLGSPVFAVALTNGGARVTSGFVSSVARAFRGPRGRRISGTIEHTAPLAPGSSGSPLVDATGRLVGLNTNRLGGGFYLALPADEALRQRIDALARGVSPERPRLGVGIAPAHVARRLRRAVGLPDRDGVLVREVEPDSPAERAGIAVGDLIVEAGGRPIGDPDDVYDALGTIVPGGSLELRLVRGAEERSVTAIFAPGPTNGQPAGEGRAPAN
jgi:S1-C subfamily serine protease